MAAEKPILTYWEGRGRAESIRLAMAFAGIEWTDAPYLKKTSDIQKLRDEGKLLFEQVPLLQWNGKNLVQTNAIVRHIARKYGFDGKTEEEKLQADILYEGLVDCLLLFLTYCFLPEAEVMKGIREKALTRYMPVYEKILASSKSGFLVGDSITMADWKLFEIVANFPERCPDAFDTFPKLKKFYEKIMAVPQIQKYMNGPQRFGPNTPRYVSEVKTTLGW